MMTTRIPATAILLVLLLSHATVPAEAAGDERLVGVWKAVSYTIEGTRHEMHGLFIFTPRYYSANVRFKMAEGPHDDSNGNAGPYTADGKQIVFVQWVQIHVRPGSATEPILSREGPDEPTDYRIEGKRLLLTFPSGNQYVLERLADLTQ